MRIRAAILLAMLVACADSEAEWQPPVGSFSSDSTTLTDSERPELVKVARVQVTPTFIDSLPVPPLLGRSLMADDFGARRAALISERFWRSYFGARPDVIGRTVTLGAEPVIIVGVMPASVTQPEGAEIWVARE